jgi:light-regulated signal transduction histidine kinase (bacteriophytochrome)
MSNSVETYHARLEQLERLLEQRTVELRDIRNELENFNYSVSHDLRAPLRHITGYAKIIMEDYGATLDPECHGHFQKIQEGARRMSALMDELAKLSRIGRQGLSRQKVSLDALVQDVEHDLAQEIPDRKIEWRNGHLPLIECDIALMKQLFVNLLSNAVKFTRGRENAVIETGAIHENGATTFFVRDNGIGFDMKYAGKLFTIFQRLHSHQDFEGHGAGLAIAKRIISRHGGIIWAESALNQGATFYFTLGHDQAKGQEA